MTTTQLLLWLTLISWALVVYGKAPCHTYTSKGQLRPATGSVVDAIFVGDTFNAEDASLMLDVSHRRVGALQITLTAQDFGSYQRHSTTNARTIVIKALGLGKLGNDLYHTTFTDASPASFPQGGDASPFTGSFRPTQPLRFLLEGNDYVAGNGGAQGVWILQISDLAPNATRRDIFLNGWSLTLCEPALSDDPSPSPSPSPVPIPQPISAAKKQPQSLITASTAIFTPVYPTLDDGQLYGFDPTQPQTLQPPYVVAASQPQDLQQQQQLQQAALQQQQQLQQAALQQQQQLQQAALQQQQQQQLQQAQQQQQALQQQLQQALQQQAALQQALQQAEALQQAQQQQQQLATPTPAQTQPLDQQQLSYSQTSTQTSTPVDLSAQDDPAQAEQQAQLASAPTIPTQSTYSQQQPVVASSDGPADPSGQAMPTPLTTGTLPESLPIAANGYQNPTTVASYQNPSATASYQGPSTIAGYQDPSTAVGYQNPSTATGYQNPSATAPRQDPTATMAYQDPSATASYPNYPNSATGYQDQSASSTEYQDPSAYQTSSTNAYPVTSAPTQEPARASFFGFPIRYTTSHRPKQEQQQLVPTEAQPAPGGGLLGGGLFRGGLLGGGGGAGLFGGGLLSRLTGAATAPQQTVPAATQPVSVLTPQVTQPIATATLPATQPNPSGMYPVASSLLRNRAASGAAATTTLTTPVVEAFDGPPTTTAIPATTTSPYQERAAAATGHHVAAASGDGAMFPIAGNIIRSRLASGGSSTSGFAAQIVAQTTPYEEAYDGPSPTTTMAQPAASTAQQTSTAASSGAGIFPLASGLIRNRLGNFAGASSGAQAEPQVKAFDGPPDTFDPSATTQPGPLAGNERGMFPIAGGLMKNRLGNIAGASAGAQDGPQTQAFDGPADTFGMPAVMQTAPLAGNGGGMFPLVGGFIRNRLGNSAGTALAALADPNLELPAATTQPVTNMQPAASIGSGGMFPLAGGFIRNRLNAMGHASAAQTDPQVQAFDGPADSMGPAATTQPDLTAGSGGGMFTVATKLLKGLVGSSALGSMVQSTPTGEPSNGPAYDGAATSALRPASRGIGGGMFPVASTLLRGLAGGSTSMSTAQTPGADGGYGTALTAASGAGTGLLNGVLGGGQLRQGLDSWMQQSFGAICSDTSCTNVKQGIWKVLFISMYAHALVEGSGDIKQHALDFMDKLKDFLPGENPAIGKMIDWLSSHKSQLAALGGNVVNMLESAGIQSPLSAIFGKGSPLAAFLQQPSGGGLAQLASSFGLGGGDKGLGSLFGFVDSKSSSSKSLTPSSSGMASSSSTHSMGSAKPSMPNLLGGLGGLAGMGNLVGGMGAGGGGMGDIMGGLMGGMGGGGSGMGDIMGGLMGSMGGLNDLMGGKGGMEDIIGGLGKALLQGNGNTANNPLAALMGSFLGGDGNVANDAVPSLVSDMVGHLFDRSGADALEAPWSVGGSGSSSTSGGGGGRSASSGGGSTSGGDSNDKAAGDTGSSNNKAAGDTGSSNNKAAGDTGSGSVAAEGAGTETAAAPSTGATGVPTEGTAAAAGADSAPGGSAPADTGPSGGTATGNPESSTAGGATDGNGSPAAGTATGEGTGSAPSSGSSSGSSQLAGGSNPFEALLKGEDIQKLMRGFLSGGAGT